MSLYYLSRICGSFSPAYLIGLLPPEDIAWPFHLFQINNYCAYSYIAPMRSVCEMCAKRSLLIFCINVNTFWQFSDKNYKKKFSWSLNMHVGTNLWHKHSSACTPRQNVIILNSVFMRLAAFTDFLVRFLFWSREKNRKTRQSIAGRKSLISSIYLWRFSHDRWI